MIQATPALRARPRMARLSYLAESVLTHPKRFVEMQHLCDDSSCTAKFSKAGSFKDGIVKQREGVGRRKIH